MARRKSNKKTANGPGARSTSGGQRPTATSGTTAGAQSLRPTLSGAAVLGTTGLPQRLPRLRPLIIDDRLLLGLGLVAVAAGAIWAVRGILVALLFVVVFTFLGAPVVERLEKRGLPRAAGAGICVVGGLLLITALLAMVLPALISDLIELVQRGPELFQMGVVHFEQFTGFTLPTTFRDFSGTAAKELLDQLSPIAAKGGSLVGQGAVGLAKGAASAAGTLGQALLVPVLTFFMLTELPALQRMIYVLLPRRPKLVVTHYAPMIDRALSSLVRGQLTVAAIMAVIYAVGLFISGVPLALAIAVLAGAAYVIPFASATTCVVLAIAFSLLELGGAAAGPIVGAVITAVVVQLLEGYVFTPRIVGERAGLSPLATLLAVLFGGSAAGFLGVLFALPTGAVVALVVGEIVARRHDDNGPTPSGLGGKRPKRGAIRTGLGGPPPSTQADRSAPDTSGAEDPTTEVSQ